MRIFGFFIIVLYSLIILLIMPKIRWKDVDKKLLIKTIFYTIIITLIISLLRVFIFPKKCLFIYFIDTSIFIVGFVLLFLYLWIYKKRFWHDWMFAFIATLIVIFVTISIFLLQPIINECNEEKAISMKEYVDNYVKGAVYIYDNKNGQENVTIIICNNGTRAFNEIISISLYHNISFNISIRKKDNHSDLSGWWLNPTIKEHPKHNWTSVEYSRPNFSITLGDKAFLYVNFTVKWNFSKKFTEPYYAIYIDEYKPYIARIYGRPPIELLPNSMDWDMQPIFNIILKYERNRWSDW
ncbi:MAG TPA: hypothetical protein ENI52_05715 [Thermoplasmata archaeon]|nr:hypothetical protein [Thermoplasmata archaeon]